MTNTFSLARRWFPNRVNRSDLERGNAFYGSTSAEIGDYGQLTWRPYGSKVTEYVLRCKIGTDSLSIGLNRWPKRWFDVRLLPDASESEYLDIYEAAAHDLLTLFESLSGHPIECAQLERQQLTPPGAIGFSVLGSAVSDSYDGWFEANTLTTSMQKNLFPKKTIDLPFWALAIPMNLSLTIAETTIDASEMTGLAAGDLIRLALPATDLQQLSTAFRPTASTRCTGSMYASRFYLEKIMMDENTQSSINSFQDCSSISVKEVPVALSFEVGRLTLTLAQISQLAVGASLEIGCKTSELRVRVLANGTAIGAGELVDVNDEIAVLLTELGDH